MLLSMIRPLCKWHLLMAVALLDLALIFTSICNNPEDVQERRLQQVLARSREVAQAVQETRDELEAFLKSEKWRLQALEHIDQGLTDLETQLGRLRAVNEGT
ncbi:hypothetical protein Bpfe_023246 [Biomphalaria pfeifferi]|uniref:Uncharacterized protein n=1 Tax=Biomphalaria pfeifferi TaxID=112525 RepID=A0AAD8B3C4_BIOPF|nr:hypothetical protein Bpfe_023246 [Biomphalaria pfeifferi]